MNNFGVSLEDDKHEYHDASFVQKRIFLLSQKDKKISGWNISYVLEIAEGEFNHEKLNIALNEVVNRHESLRTSFRISKGAIKQIIHDTIEFSVDYCNDGCSLENYIDMLSKPFDLGHAPLMWVKNVTTSDHKNYFIICLHHLIADEISIKIILHEIIAFYHGHKIEKAPVQYKEYSALQNKNYYNGYLKQQEEYWLKVFQKDVAEQKLTAFYSNTCDDISGGERLFFDLGVAMSKKVKELVREKNITCYWYLMSVFFVFMSKYLRSDDILIGITISGRYYPRFAQSVGMFLNILPLRIYVDQNIQFIKFIEVVKECFLEAYENQEYPFECLYEKISKNGNMLELNTSFQMHMITPEVIEVGEDIKLKPIDVFYKTSVQDIVLGSYEKEDNIYFYLNYSTAKFRKETIETFIQSFKDMILKAIDTPNIIIYNLTGIGDEKII